MSIFVPISRLPATWTVGLILVTWSVTLSLVSVLESSHLWRFNCLHPPPPPPPPPSPSPSTTTPPPLLSTGYCVLCTVYCLQFTVYCLLSTAKSSQVQPSLRSEVYWLYRILLNQIEGGMDEQTDRRTDRWTDIPLRASCRTAPLWSGKRGVHMGLK